MRRVEVVLRRWIEKERAPRFYWDRLRRQTLWKDRDDVEQKKQRRWRRRRVDGENEVRERKKERKM